jgi:hypothetical protein
MLISPRAIAAVGVLLGVLGVAGFVSTVFVLLFFGASSGSTIATVLVLLPLIIVTGLAGAGCGLTLTNSDYFSVWLFGKRSGLHADQLVRLSFYDFDVIVPHSHRKRNPAVAAAIFRCVFRAREESVKVYSRIASNLLTPTDAAVLFGDRLDDFVYAFGQSVGDVQDQLTTELLFLVRDGHNTPEEVIAYLRELKSVRFATQMLHDGVALDYAKALA